MAMSGSIPYLVKSSLIVGSSSKIAEWIITSISTLDHKIFKISRSDDSDRLHSRCDQYLIEDIRGSISNFRTLGAKFSSVYYCPGSICMMPIAKSDPDLWIRDFQINIFGAYYIYHSLISHNCIAEDGLRFFVIGSTSSVSMKSGMSSYWISKLALENLVTAINNEDPSSIRACCLRLGRCKTPFIGSEHDVGLVSESDVSRVVRYLESCSVDLLPDLISIRPILSLNP